MNIATYKNKRHTKARALLRANGWQLFHGVFPKGTDYRLEFWGKAGRTLIMQFWPSLGGGFSCYFCDGNPTWEEWEKMLQ